MNEFLEQFLIEAHELVEQATADLLGLEERPDDRERLDGAFRAFHTLKGAAGIVEFAAMGRVMHAAENVLSSIRADADAVNASLIGDCLASLDQVVQWLEAMQDDGAPPQGADAQADAMIARFDLMYGGGETLTQTSPVNAPGSWVGDILALYPAAAAQALTAIRFAPDRDCFFKGEDPLARIANVPGLLALSISSLDVWPVIEALDPFRCQMIITALARSLPEDAIACFESVREQVVVRDLRDAEASAEDSGLSASAIALIEAQIQLIADAAQDGFAGRLVSAARVAVNVLRRSGRVSDAASIEQAFIDGQFTLSAPALTVALAEILKPPPSLVESLAAVDEPRLRAEPLESASRVLRVEVDRIDKLVKLVGELTVVKTAVAHVAGLADSGADAKAIALALKDQHALLERLLNQLQGAVLNLRVLPLRHVFQRFPKLVREMAATVGKVARLVTEGDGTEADKTIVEALFEPLLHVLRNAVDHGVETAQERAAQGKSDLATIYLRARRQSENLIVEVVDDGRGVNIDRVRAVALKRGVVTPEALAAMTEDGIADLIFQPGFSTSEGVTDLSGRGVGMDAVRSAITRLGGDVRIETKAGRGSTVRLTLPFSVMVTRIMTVETDGQLFGIALDSVVETLSLPRERIMPLGTSFAFVLRDRTIPLLALADYLGSSRPKEMAPAINIVVALVAGEMIGLQVDRVISRMDVMLQPMDGFLSKMRGIAGTTLLGDGGVLLVLDLEELLR